METYEQNALLARFYDIPGLEVDEALERLLNNKSFYLKLVERFVKERRGIADLIEAAIMKNDFEEAGIQAHTFKTLAGTIGAVEVERIALELELAFRDGHKSPGLLQRFRVKVQQLMASLQ